MPHKYTSLMAATLLALSVNAAWAEGPFRNPDNKNPNDAGEGTYPIPYKMPQVAEITETLHRVRNYMDSVTPTRIIDKKTKQPITDLSTPTRDAIIEPSEGDFGITVYEMGVVHAGLIKARQVTGDAKFTAMTERHLNFFGQVYPYFKKQEELFKLERANSLSRFIDPRSLDDAGSMCAAMMRAAANKIGPDLSHIIKSCSDWVANKQVRLKDGTLARNRPQAWSLWGDDMYMGVPALAESGRYYKQTKYFDDAVKNVLNMSKYLFNDHLGIYTHGWNQNNPDAPRFYWARANGWCVLAMSDLLDVLPKNHPGYPKVLAQLRKTLKGLSEYQSGKTGLWHNSLDRNDSFVETSASAMFVYGLAHAINEGWISPTTYGSIAQAGWQGITAKVNAKGQVEGTVVGTTFASDQVYYYNRPVSPHALHGYGPVLLAGAEMIRLITNPNLAVEHKVRTYHYMPKGVNTNYREHH